MNLGEKPPKAVERIPKPRLDLACWESGRQSVPEMFPLGQRRDEEAVHGHDRARVVAADEVEVDHGDKEPDNVPISEVR